jgi:hypothetical protein
MAMEQRHKWETSNQETMALLWETTVLVWETIVLLWETTVISIPRKLSLVRMCISNPFYNLISKTNFTYR